MKPQNDEGTLNRFVNWKNVTETESQAEKTAVEFTVHR